MFHYIAPTTRVHYTSRIFEKEFKSDSGPKLDICLLSFIYNGFIIAHFSLSGKTPIERTLLHM